jgi:hypothetical protein
MTPPTETAVLTLLVEARSPSDALDHLLERDVAPSAELADALRDLGQRYSHEGRVRETERAQRVEGLIREIGRKAAGAFKVESLATLVEWLNDPSPATSARPARWSGSPIAAAAALAFRLGLVVSSVGRRRRRPGAAGARATRRGRWRQPR